MSDKYFVDTNVLMYAHDRAAGAKHEQARALVEELWRDESGVISTQVLQELAANLQRKMTPALTAQAAREVVGLYRAWDVVVNDGDAILAALDLQSRHRISFWDALILRAADARGVDVVYSEDLSDGHAYGSVRVVNPFRDGEKKVYE